MDVLEAILNRRSIRQYTGQAISDDVIETLLKAAMYAPSAVNKQPWHYIVFRDREIGEKIISFHQNASMLRQADAAILVCWDEELEHDAGYGPVDCSAATQNILLAAFGLGLGTVWDLAFTRAYKEWNQSMHYSDYRKTSSRFQLFP